MQTRFRLYLAIALLGGVFAIHLTGCSLIGFGIGSLIDNARTTHYRTTGTRQFFTISPGTPIVLHMRDSTTIAGRYRGWRALPDSVYASHYQAWRAALPAEARPPQFGQKVILTDQRHRTHHGVFAGFGLYSVRLELTHTFYEEHAFDELISARIEHGHAFGFDSAAAGIETGRLPLYAELSIEGSDSTYHLDPSTIATVTMPVAKHARHVGLAVGVFADMLVVAVVVAAATYKPDYSGCSPNYTGTTYLAQPAPRTLARPMRH